MRRAVSLTIPILSAALFWSACAPRRVALPTGGGTPAADYAVPFGAATSACRGVRTLTADLALSGSAGRQKVRGHVLAGFAPARLRLEGVAPFGGPVFILAAEGARGTLLLPRDRRVLESSSPAEILAALVGVPLSPDDLLAALTGCVSAAAEPVGALAYGPDWLVVQLKGGALVYLNRRSGSWRVAAGRNGTLEIEYGAAKGGLPADVRLRSAPGQVTQVDLQMKLQEFEMNAEIDAAAFTVAVPPGTSPISLDELRRSGPLGR